jgi:hypothetical protein
MPLKLAFRENQCSENNTVFATVNETLPIVCYFLRKWIKFSIENAHKNVVRILI